MPFAPDSASAQKLQFIQEWLAKEWSMTKLCERYGVSRPCGYKWLQRYRLEGVAGLAELSRAPRKQAQALRPAVEKLILQAHAAHPTWGPKKLVVWIKQREQLERLCAVSTVGEVLRRHELRPPRRRHRVAEVSSVPLAEYDGVNAVWCIDFKGWFILGNGQRCDPLTLTDGFSRFLLRCQVVEHCELARVRQVCESAFREYGLPARIRSDNGAPFGSVAIGGLSALAVWWMKLGIVVERIAPGRPDQNGRHERMHLTMNETEQPTPAWDRAAQQRRFQKFRQCYNEERPHEALGQRTPASLYQASPRRYAGRLREPTYEAGTETRKVQQHGEFSWRNRAVFLSETLRGETVGLRPNAEAEWEIYYGPQLLGTMDEKTGKVIPLKGALRRRKKSPVQTGGGAAPRA